MELLTNCAWFLSQKIFAKYYAALPKDRMKNAFQIPFRSAGARERKNVKQGYMDYTGNLTLKREGYNYYIIFLTRPKLETGFMYLTNDM